MDYDYERISRKQNSENDSLKDKDSIFFLSDEDHALGDSKM